MTESAADLRDGAASQAGPTTCRVVGTLAGVFLGGVFLVAVYGKAIDPEAFAEVIALDGLDVVLAAWPMALIAIGAEAVLGLALVLGLRRLWVLLPTAAMVALFVFLTGRAYWEHLHGHATETAACGCFGNLLDRTPAQAFWQDLALLVPACCLAFVGRPRGRPIVPLRRTAAAVLLAAGTVVFSWRAPALPLDDLATRLSPGVEVVDLCAGAEKERLCLSDEALAWQIREGSHLVVIADLEDEAFQQDVGDRLEEFLDHLAQGGAPILVLFSGSKDDVAAFRFRARSPPFDYQEVPVMLLRPLYRRLPRTFEVRDGVVTRTWSGFPPLGALAH